ncbi:hypothetical protein QBC44DRAFT_368669 [Cladorrhinum sp. PSN332]|nr:hypothetical protein QBC44DRAFT_368669 [Cladorrhinum sp. PSN332]
MALSLFCRPETEASPRHSERHTPLGHAEQLLYFPYLDLLDDTLIEHQVGHDWDKFEAFASHRGKRTAKKALFVVGCSVGFSQYIDWVMRQNSQPKWLYMPQAQLSILAIAYREWGAPAENGSAQTLRQLLDRGFDPNEIGVCQSSMSLQ